MAVYIHLMKLTDQGIKDIKNAPKRVDEAAKNMKPSEAS
jgi:uncharacterized protein with GYD domain